MNTNRRKASALLMLPSLTVLATTLQAADVNPVWVEYTSTPPTTTSESAVATPASTAPAVTPTADAASPTVAAPAIAPVAAPAAVAVPTAATEQPTAPAAAAPVANGSPVEGNGNEMTVSAVITPRIFAFDYFKGVDDNLPHYLERYDYRDGLSGDKRSGIDLDADVSLTMNNGDRDIFVIERQGFGQHNHRGKARFDDDEITLSGSYSHYRSATGGIDYLYSPAIVSGADIATFGAGNETFLNNTGTTEYHLDRTSYAAGFKVKPSLLDGTVTVALDYSGYKREGNQLATSIVMAGGGVIESWNGVNLAVDERMNKFSFSLAASPRKLFNVAYEITLEKFTNQAPDLIRNDILGTSGNSRQDLSPFYYVPDTSQLSQTLRVNKNVGDRAVIAAGIGYTTLKDESSPERFTATFGGDGGPDSWEGEINSSNAYLTVNANVSPRLSVEAHIKQTGRNNDSSYPVQHVIAPTGPNARMAGPRIDSIDSMDYGVGTSWRLGIMNSSLSLGWQRIDQERDLTYATYSEAIPANRVFYREKSLSDEVYLKWVATPAAGVTLRLNPSYTWADKTGLIVEPEQALALKTTLSYAAPSGWLLSGFYDHKNRKNNDLYVTGDLTGAGAQFNQDIESIFRTAGATFNVSPYEAVNTSISLYWMQNDFKSYFLSSDLLRQHLNPNIVFTNYGLSNYKVDSYVANLSGDWRASERLKLSGAYTLTQNTGDTASGEILLALQNATGTTDSRIDNILHSISLGADYTLGSKTTLRASYVYDYYEDNAYDLLTGGVNTLAIGVSFSM